jgi:hypothetical protein
VADELAAQSLGVLADVRREALGDREPEGVGRENERVVLVEGGGHGVQQCVL